MTDVNLKLATSSPAEKETDMLSERFLSYVFHELRTPLTVVHSYAQIALDKLPEGTEFDGLRRIMSRMIDQGEEMVDMIEELLEAARIPLGTLNLDQTEVELAQLIEEAVEHLPEEWPSSVVFSHLDTPTLIFADAQRLERALGTLFKFSLGEQQDQDSSSQINVNYQPDPGAGRVEIEIVVPGLELTAEQQQDLFDLYRPVREGPKFKGKSGSLDIGLYVAKGIIEAHQGSLNFDQNLPGFKIALPVAQE